jgi:hypothetical protein
MRVFLPLLLWGFGAQSDTVVKALNKAADLNNASLYTVLPFTAGSSDLSTDARNQLRHLVDRAREQGQVAEVKIVSWADKEYPKGRRRSLDRASRRIADERAMEVRNYFTDNVHEAKVTRYNMAERPDAVEKLLNTSPNVQVKKSLAAVGLTKPEKSGQPPMASNVLVLVVVK